MLAFFYDDPLQERAIPRSIFLAGPTVRGQGRTPWRAEAMAWLEARGFDGTVLVPEFRQGSFDELARAGVPISPTLPRALEDACARVK